MSDKPHAELLNSEISSDFQKDLAKLRTILYYPENDEVIFREIQGCGFDICAVFIDGMANADQVSDFIIKASQLSEEATPQEARAEYLMKRAFEVAQVSTEKCFSELVKMILSGMTVVLAEGLDTAIAMDTRGFERRKVDQANKERVVMGSQEGFVEDLRANLTLLHRYVQTPELMCEKITVGTKIPLRIAIVHIKGVTNKTALEKVKKRIRLVDTDVVHGIGELQQLIEDSPWSVMPQMLMTERPDRAAAALVDGQFAILADTSPYALIAPCSIFTLMQAPDDAFSRWQYGSYSRVIRYLGLIFALLLPGLYVALTMYHTHLIPMALLTAIAETRSNVPFPILFEIGAMELSFFLINEANMRIPSQIGSFIGIIGALVLGQAAVEASLVSPILIILIAVSGLGCYAMPDYSVSVALILFRLTLVVAGAAMGIYGIILVLFLMLCQLCHIRSFGMHYFAPVAPHAPHNPDILLRLPIFMQKIPLFLIPRRSWLRKGGTKSNKSKKGRPVA